jgi:hypothetical protein
MFTSEKWKNLSHFLLVLLGAAVLILYLESLDNGRFQHTRYLDKEAIVDTRNGTIYMTFASGGQVGVLKIDGQTGKSETIKH